MLSLNRLRWFGLKDKYRLTVSFQGMALEDHSIDVNYLAPSMIALGQLLEDANSALNNGDGTISTRAVATSEGSFEITFMLDQALQGLFVGTAAIPVSQIVQILFFNMDVGISLSGLLKWLRNEEYKERVEGNKTIIEKNNGDTKIINNNVSIVLNNSKIVNGLSKVVYPVTSNGIDEIIFMSEKKDQTERITKEDYQFIAIDVDEEIITDNTLRDQLLDILSIGKSAYKWHLSHGGEKNYYKITDPDFLAEQRSGQRISVEKDMLKADIRYVQKRNRTSGKITTEREIVKAQVKYNSEEQFGLSYIKDDEETNS
jgi:hypothetical protein